MEKTVIRVEDLGKLYKLGEIGTGTLSRDLQRWWAKARGREDPFAKIGEINDRTVKGGDYVWALKDIGFEVKEGEVLGIIGRNGAGKSTLLKLLSKVTTPTKGKIKIRGRIASLLEVGTGFHPELTGRENVFLNGAILGMSKEEIKRKFDEIVDFAGVERYIDTPVKRYSSGMYVRLAFAVAAFLEPEILIVDEVLAVGDTEFQRKCLGRMQDVSKNDGRTVLFVSHDLNAIAQLCSRTLLIRNGQLNAEGETQDVIARYLSGQKNDVVFRRNNHPGKTTYINEIMICDDEGNPLSTFFYDKQVNIHFKIVIDPNLTMEPDLFVMVLDSKKRRVFACEANTLHEKMQLTLLSGQLVRGEYSLIAFINVPNKERIDEVVDVCNFEIIDNGSTMMKHGMYDYGVVLGRYKWSY